jgi:hypothetical protein
VSDYQVLFYDGLTNLQTAEVSIFNRLEFNSVFNGVGRFTVEMPYDANAQLVTYGTKIMIYRNGSLVFSGRVTKWNRQFSDKGNLFTLTGEDENAVLANSLTFPVPLGPPYSAVEFDARSGIASTVMLAYVENNIGASARSDRRQVTCGPDYAYGVTVSEQARWERLLDVLKRVAEAGGGLGFRVVNSIFQVYLPETKPVLISLEMGNLFSYEYSVEAARANYIIVGGSETGTTRTFYEASDALSMTRYGRIESFVNRTDVSTAAMAASAMNEAIYTNSDKTLFSAVALETEATRCWTDYNLGDRVTVEADNLRITDVVREIRVKWNGQTGERIETAIGNSDGLKMDPILASLDANSRLSARVRRLETR